MHVGLYGRSSGFSAYRRSVTGLAVARRLGERVSLGLRFNYHQLRIAGYGKAVALTADMGILCHLSPKMHFGIQLNNPGSDRKERGLPVPAMYICGLGYEPSATLSFSLEVVKEQSRAVEARWGVQYAVSSPILLRILVQTRDPSVWFGTGLSKGKYRLDLYSNYHLQLGMGVGLVLYWHFEGKSDGVEQ